MSTNSPRKIFLTSLPGTTGRASLTMKGAPSWVSPPVSLLLVKAILWLACLVSGVVRAGPVTVGPCRAESVMDGRLSSATSSGLGSPPNPVPALNKDCDDVVSYRSPLGTLKLLYFPFPLYKFLLSAPYLLRVSSLLLPACSMFELFALELRSLFMFELSALKLNSPLHILSTLLLTFCSLH